MQIPFAKQILIFLAALIAAFVLSLSIGYVRVYWDQWIASLGSGTGFSSPSEQEKLNLLESLKASNTPSVAERARVVENLDTSKEETSEQRKLDILKSLR